MFVESNGIKKTSPLNVLQLLSRKHCSLGDDLWWQTIRLEGTPLIIDTIGEYSELLFLWREPSKAPESNVEDVFIEINGVTDHHCFNMAKLSHIKGTDVWTYNTKIKSTWRGGYAFIPVSKSQVQPNYQGSLQEQKMQHRQWLRSIFPLSQPDDFNPQRLLHCEWGSTKTPLHMPHALPQIEWRPFDTLSGAKSEKC